MRALFIITTIISTMSVVSGHLDESTMEKLIQAEFDAIRPFDHETFMDLWALDDDSITFCDESGCAVGVDAVTEVAHQWEVFHTLSCERPACYYIPPINQASCSWTCVGDLVVHPGCITDVLHGQIVYDWNNDGKLVRIDDYYNTAEYEQVMASCMPSGSQEVLGMARSNKASKSLTGLQEEEVPGQVKVTPWLVLGMVALAVLAFASHKVWKKHQEEVNYTQVV